MIAPFASCFGCMALRDAEVTTKDKLTTATRSARQAFADPELVNWVFAQKFSERKKIKSKTI